MDIIRVGKTGSTTWQLKIDPSLQTVNLYNLKPATPAIFSTDGKRLMVNANEKVETTINILTGLPITSKTHNFFRVYHDSSVGLGDMKTVITDMSKSESTYEETLMYIYVNGDIRDFNDISIYLVNENVVFDYADEVDINASYAMYKIFVNMIDNLGIDNSLAYTLMFDKADTTVKYPLLQTIPEMSGSVSDLIDSKWLIHKTNSVLMHPVGETLTFEIIGRICNDLYTKYTGGIITNTGLIMPDENGVFTIPATDCVIASADCKRLVTPLGNLDYGLSPTRIEITQA